MKDLKICLHCQTSFVPKRSDAKYCSSACRFNAFQKRKQEKETQSSEEVNGHEPVIHQKVVQEKLAPMIFQPRIDEQESMQPRWTNREQKAINRCHDKIRELVETIQLWDLDEYEIKVKKIRKYLKGIKRFLSSQVYLDLPADAPMGNWLERMHKRVFKWFSQIPKDEKFFPVNVSDELLEYLEETIDEIDDFELSS